MGLALLGCALWSMPVPNDPFEQHFGPWFAHTVKWRVERGLFTAAAWRINRENFQRIKKGMTLRAVEDLLGGPPGQYVLFTSPIFCCFADFSTCRGIGARVRWEDEIWTGDAGAILLHFKYGKVTLRAFFSRTGESLGNEGTLPDYED
jgi:hypothetical protein